MPDIAPPTKSVAPVALPALPDVLAEPRAGGNYLRDPVTGALSPNPAFEIPQE